MQSRETQITMVKWTNAGGQTKRANERSFVYRPPAWRRWRNVKTTYSIETYRFTSCAFTFRPLHESPLHRSQNNRSAFFNSAGFLPSRLAPGISFSVSRSGAVNVFTWGAAILELQSYPHPPRFHVLVPRLTRAVRHYEFGVFSKRWEIFMEMV